MRQLVVYHRTGILAIPCTCIKTFQIKKQPEGKAYCSSSFRLFLLFGLVLQLLAHLCLFVEDLFDCSVSSQDIDNLFESPLLQRTDGDGGTDA